MFARLGRACHDHPVRVVLLWVAALFLANAVLGGLGGAENRTEFTLPDVESQDGIDILDANYGGAGAGNNGQIVFRADPAVFPDGIEDPDVREAMEETFAEVADVEKVRAVDSPYDVPPEGEVPPDVLERIDGNGDGLVDRLVSDDEPIAFAEVQFPADIDFSELPAIRSDVEDALPHIDGLRVELGTEFFAEAEPPESEAIGVAFAIFILIAAFGSVVAMGLPIGVAVAGIFAGLTFAGLASHVMDISDFITFLGPMIGLGVGIDYALFIVTRFRENLHKGHDIRQSTAIALDTAGRAVLFAGATVVVSLVGMVIMGLGFVTGIAVGTALVVASTVVASLTLLPALLRWAGPRIETTRVRGLIGAVVFALLAAGVGLKLLPAPVALLIAVVVVVLVSALSYAIVPLQREVLKRSQKDARQTLAYRWSRVIQHHPWAAALIGAGVLVVLALPLAGLRHGFSDTSNYPEDSTTRQAHELLVDGFGEGFNGPITVVTELPDGPDQGMFDDITGRLEDTEGVARVVQQPPSENDQAVMWLVFPDSAPQDEETSQLVNRLRDDVLPPVDSEYGLDVATTGTVPINLDFTEYLSERLPYFFAAVLGLSFLLLMVVFRSLLVPVKAVIMNLLSIGAAYGVVVAGFQWGWLGPILNIEGAPIEPFVPMMMFAIVFGLSMDYEVFLLSRIKEEWDRTGDSHTSVADGLALTARVITAAALIMVFVFGAFMGDPNRVSKLFGLGLATAVLLDATVVRMLLVPATMELLGDRNWWLPRWLDRILPRVQIDVVEDESDRELERV